MKLVLVASVVLATVMVAVIKDEKLICSHPFFKIGDLVFDVDLGVGIIKQIYADADVDGIIYYVWWLSVDDHSFEYPEELMGLG